LEAITESKFRYLKGFIEAIAQSIAQICGRTHPECITLSGMEKQNNFATDLKPVYGAANKELACTAFKNSENTWVKNIRMQSDHGKSIAKTCLFF
jgi:hypothetical protein